MIEHGPEAYGVIAPMELVVNAAIFHDIAHMRVGGNLSNVDTSLEKVEIYYPKTACEDDKETTISEELQECSASVDDTDKETSKSGEPEKETEVKAQVRFPIINKLGDKNFHSDKGRKEFNIDIIIWWN